MSVATRNECKSCTGSLTEIVIIPCLYCGKPLEYASDSLIAQGVFNSFCNDSDCEDLFSETL